MDKFLYKNKLGITALSASIKKFSYKKHAHEEYALGVTLKGVQEYQLDGCSLSSHKNGIMLFNPEQIHNGNAGNYKDGLDYVMLYIKPKLFLKSLDKKEIIKFSSSIVYKNKLQQDILKLSSSILKDEDEALCTELYLNLMENFSKKDFYSTYKNEHTLIKRAKEMIYYELASVLNIQEISKELKLSKFQFIRIFKANTGITPYQYFLNYKIINAKKYLEKTKDLYACVVEFGFSDLSHLNRHFKKMYGITAYEYLLQNTNKEIYDFNKT